MDVSQDNRGPELVALMAAFLGITYLAVSLRCFVRLKIMKSFDVDDWLMLASLGIFTLYGGFVFAGVHYGMGRHNTSLPQAEEIQALKYQALATAIYIANMAILKLSIAIFLLRIAVQRRYIYILKASMVVVSIWTAGVFLFDVFECQPVQFQWDYTIPGGQCVPGDSLVSAAYAFSVLSVLSDCLYALLPVPMLWSVKMNPQTKFAVVVILGLGVFASVATLVRIRYLIDLASMRDILYASTDTMIWTILEPGIGITAASIVTLRPLLRALRVPGFSTSSPTDPAFDMNPTFPTSSSRHNHAHYIRSSHALDDFPASKASATTVSMTSSGGSVGGGLVGGSVVEGRGKGGENGGMRRTERRNHTTGLRILPPLEDEHFGMGQGTSVETHTKAVKSYAGSDAESQDFILAPSATREMARTEVR